MTSKPDDWQSMHDGRLSAMIEVAQAAGRHTLKYFGATGLVVDAKKPAPVLIAGWSIRSMARSRSFAESRFIRRFWPSSAMAR